MGALDWQRCMEKRKEPWSPTRPRTEQVSRFNPSARNSYYTTALLEGGWAGSNADLSTMLNATADDVYVLTGQSQMPYLYGRLFGKLYLGEVPPAASFQSQ